MTNIETQEAIIQKAQDQLKKLETRYIKEKRKLEQQTTRLAKKQEIERATVEDLKKRLALHIFLKEASTQTENDHNKEVY